MTRFARLGLAAVLAMGCASVATTPQIAEAQVSFGFGVTISASIPPPTLPFYAQPPIPGPNFIWTPGYWAWDNYEDGYYWVPGAWVEAPEPGLLWTPGYWGWADDVYIFHPGYWGPHVGFYGGVAYGFGYTGFGYQGGYWNGGNFFYNRTVNHITNVNITNVYTQNVTVTRTTINNVSFNGGPGGVQARPTPEQAAFARAPHIAPTPMQVQHQRMAASSPAQFARVNGGRPAVAATPRANVFQGPGVVRARGAPPPPSAGRPLGFDPGGPMRPARQGYKPGGLMQPARPVYNPGGPMRPPGPGYEPGGPESKGYAPGVMDRANRENFSGGPRRDFEAMPGAPRSQAQPRYDQFGAYRPPSAPRPPAMRPPPHPRPPPRPRPAPHPGERR